MQIAFKTKNFKLTKKIKKYVQSKLLKYNRQLPEDSFIEINLEDIYGPRGGLDKKVHISADIPGEEYIHLEEATSDIYASLDLVFKKFANSITKAKGKYLNNRRKQRISKLFHRVSDLIPQKSVFHLPFKKKPVLKNIVETEMQEISEILDTDSAVQKLKNSQKPYYLFIHSESKKLNLIYRDKFHKYHIQEIKIHHA